MTKQSGPLAGVRILDMTSVIMGPYATQILAALGADVIKIETPEGDNMRHVGPMRNPGMGHIFLHANQGKRSLVLDLKQPQGRDAVLRLAERADVLITNVRPQAVARLGLDYESVKQRNPGIIHVSCCGFGQDGPYAGKAAYDDLIQGATGLPWLMQRYGSEQPCYAPVTMGDRVTGLHAVYAVTTALYAREKTGIGQAVVVPMFEAMAQFVLGDHLAGLSFEPPQGEAGYARLLTTHRRPYRTRDGYLCVLIYNDKHWRNFFAAIGTPQRFFEDQRFTTHGMRAANIDAVYAEVGALMLERSTAEWQALLDSADIPNMPMNSPADLLEDAHLRQTGFVRRVEHPTEGTLNITGNPVAWTHTVPDPDVAAAPQLGEHSAEILAEAGYSQLEIEQMMAAGVSAGHPRPEERSE
ncbi:CaiB/BaiF CoA transferase family protein [Noviherbaspirillum aerium]|uniref:CaiB/BaiF CoA transferase family protein n=1 Tax=Noviherbaspirillum aerium TaxID=2588497 RepID=UPI00124BDF50|nr:CoA transferase [Noviherbaspirillum aerium]